MKLKSNWRLADVICPATVLAFSGYVVSLYVTDYLDGEKYQEAHAQMAQILRDEMPVDVTRITLKPDGSHEDCTFSNGKLETQGTVLNPPHDALIYGKLSRKDDFWKSDNPGSVWLESVVGNHEIHETAAISALDFRQLLRQCVEAARQERHRPPTWKLTQEQNQASWKSRQ